MQLLIRDYYRQDPTRRTRPVRADRDRRRVPALGDVRPDDQPPGLPGLPGRQVNDALGRWIAATARGPRMFAAILIAEEVLDALQREAAADERVQPLVRMVSQIHVIEEARHVRYAREELARQIRAAGTSRLAFDRLVIARTAYLTGTRLVHPTSTGRSASTRPRAGGPPGPTRTTARRCAGPASGWSRTSVTWV